MALPFETITHPIIPGIMGESAEPNHRLALTQLLLVYHHYLLCAKQHDRVAV